MFEEILIVNLLDKYQFKSLHRILDGRDTKRLKASWLKELDDGSMLLELSKEKNYAEGIKDPYAKSENSLISADISENIYIPVAVIRKYLSKHLNNVVDDYFFSSINTPKKVYHGDWYLISKLGKESHDTTMHNICKDAKLDFKDHSITNYSMQFINIHNLILLLNYINKEFFKASDLLFSKFNEIDSEANVNNGPKTKVDNKSEAKTNNEINS
ncbi:7240_t:CDS:2, partial [Cetraspora pellucida]